MSAEPGNSSIPPYLMMDLGYSIAMFLVAVIGMRFTLKNCFGVDIFDFHTLPAQVAGGVVGTLSLFSVYRLVSNPLRVRRLGRKLVGREYAQQQSQMTAAATPGTAGVVRSVTGAAGGPPMPGKAV